jgi:hypothetical protein
LGQPRAGLPLLDWRAGISADMAAEVLRQCDAEVGRSGIIVRTGAQNLRLAGLDLRRIVPWAAFRRDILPASNCRT